MTEEPKKEQEKETVKVDDLPKVDDSKLEDVKGGRSGSMPCSLNLQCGE